MANIKDFTSELGSSGINRAGGFLAWDWVPELNGVRGAYAYREMAYTDALLHGMVYSVQMLLRRMQWRVEPADDSREAKRFADEFRKMLFVDLRKTPWPGVVADASTMIIYGYAPLELVYRRDKAKGTLAIDKIAYRAQTSVNQWEFDDEGEGDVLLGMWQQPYDRPLVFIPIEKLCIPRTVLESANPEGRSILRGAYKYYVQKRVLEEAEGRKLMRSAGLVVGRAPMRWMTTTATPDERALYASFVASVKKIAEDRQAAIVLPSDVIESGGLPGQGGQKVPLLDIEYKMNDGRSNVDFNPTLERYDKRMAASVLADWLLLGGGGSTGSWALSEDKTTMYEHATGGLADIMEGEFQHSLVHRWMALNGYPEDRAPKLRHGNLSKRDLAALSTYITAMTTAGYLTVSPNMRQFVREAGSLPEATEEELNAPVPDPNAGKPGAEGEEKPGAPGAASPNNTPDKGQDTQAGEQPEDAADDGPTHFGDGTPTRDTADDEEDDTEEGEA